MLAQLLSLVAPPRCALCASGCGSRELLCPGCAARLQLLRPRWSLVPGLDAAWSAAPYEGVARELVAALKFGRRLALAGHSAEAIAERAPAELLRGAVVPVPPSPERRRWRGFDAAQSIAAALVARTELPLTPCLRRTGGRRQVGRPRAERLADPPLVRCDAVPPEAVVLVDDVLTTGATLGACARALRSAGAGRVVALTFARS